MASDSGQARPRMPLGVLVSLPAAELGTGEGGLADRLKRVAAAGFTTMQLIGVSEEWLAEPRRSEAKRLIGGSGLRVTSVAAIYEGESYADVAAVRATVGLLPERTRAGRIRDTKRCADFANEVGSPNLSSHIGYIPEDRADPTYGAMVGAVQEICEYLKRPRMNFCLETGQESAGLLRQFIGDVGRDNLMVNFDPANMVAYGTGDPIEALEMLAPWVRGVHCKDADWPKGEGQLGEERPLGEGEVGMERFLAKLKEIGYEGPLTIEREVPWEQQLGDFLRGKKLLERLKAKLGIE
ncbi:MAG: sugar phosphate isomerase/epimerase family protein [Armatimonadota bacterium]